MKNLKHKKLLKNVGLLTIGNFASKILTFLLIPIYTNILSTSEYGSADLIFTTVSLLYPIFSILMSEAVMRFALDGDNDKQVFSSAFYITVCGTIVFLILSPFFLLFNDLKEYYIFFILYYILDVFNLILLQFSKGINKVKNYVIAGIISTIATIICNILFLIGIKMGLVGYLLAYIIGQFSSIIYITFSCKLWRFIISPRKIDKNNLKSMLSYATPMIPNSISWWISNSSDKYMLSFFSGLSVTGIYSVSYKIPSIITIFSNIFIGAWQISAVESFGNDESKKFYSDVYSNYSSFLVIAISLLITFVKIIARFLFAKDFFIAWECSSILLVATMFNSLAAFLGSIYTSAKKTKFLFHSTIIGALTNILLNYVLIRFLYAKGAAIATLASYFIVWLLRLLNSRKILEIRINHKRNILSYTILILQVIVQLLNVKYAFFYNIVLFIILIFINREIFLLALSKIKNSR